MNESQDPEVRSGRHPDSGNNLRDRIVRLEVEMESVATREYVTSKESSLQRWLIGTLLATIAALAVTLVAFLRAFSN